MSSSGRQSTISRPGSTVITRTNPKTMGGNRMSASMGMRGSNMAPGTFQAMSNTGVTDIKGTRQREKRDLQDLNERFASYIDKVHYLEANCKRLEAENEALRNRKEADLEPIRKAYENELAQARQVIDEMTAAKGNCEAKLAGLQDEVDGLRDMIATYEAHSKDYKKKIEGLGNQIGEYEGELQTLRLRVGSLEDENAKIRELLKKVQDQNKALRADLDAETAAHIEADSIAQTKGEEAAFYKDLCDMFELLKPEPVQIKGMDYNEFWKSEMKKALRDINAAYDDKLDSMQMDMDAKYATQINALKNGNVKDSMTLNRAKEDTTRLKGQLSEKNAAYAELATKLAALQTERDELARQLAELERELEQQKLKYNTDVGDLQDELSSVLAQLQTLMDAKMSLELEIACYKKLLEGEETRVGLRSMVEDALGATDKGNVQLALEAALKDQSMFDDEGQNNQQQQNTLKESTGSLTVQRSSKGPIAFKSMDHSGGNIIIENTSSGARSKIQNLKGWKLVKNAGGRTPVDITLKEYDLASKGIFTLWASGAKQDKADDNEQIANNFSFGVGSCTWKLLDDQGAEKATLNARFTG